MSTQTGALGTILVYLFAGTLAVAGAANLLLLIAKGVIGFGAYIFWRFRGLNHGDAVDFARTFLVWTPLRDTKWFFSHYRK